MTLESDAKFEEKLALGFKNDITNLVNVNESRSLKICTFMCYFSAKINAEELSLMKLKSDPNFQERLTFCLKNDLRNFMHFNWSSEKSESLSFDGIFLSKVCNI